MSKISQELEWTNDQWLEPWTVRGDEVDVGVHPAVRNARAGQNAGVIFTQVHQCFGTWAGTVVAEGREYRIEPEETWWHNHPPVARLRASDGGRGRR